MKGPEAANKLPLGKYLKQSTISLQLFCLNHCWVW